MDSVRNYGGFELKIRPHSSDSCNVRELLGGSDAYLIPKDAKLVVDIGAYIGLVSLITARNGAEVYAFEPEEENYERLRYHVEVNGYSDKVHCINKGVGIPGKTKLYLNSINFGSNSIDSSFYRGFDPDRYQMVDLVSVHSVFSEHKIDYCDFLKIDCECSEKDILEELDDSLAGKIGQISVEIHKKEWVEGIVKKLDRWYKGRRTDRKGRIWVFRKEWSE